MNDFGYTLWSLWPQLLWPQRTFCLILLVVGGYIVYSAVRTLMRLRLATKPSIAALHRQCENLRQLITGTFYLFGFTFFMDLRSAFAYRNPAIGFLIHFAFAGNVFFVLLVLHSVQAFVSGRVHARSS